MNSIVPTLVRTRIHRLRQTLDEIHEFEDAIQHHTDWPVVDGPPGLPLTLVKVAARLFRLIGIALDKLLVPFRGKVAYLSVGYIAPHYLIYKTFPWFCLPARRRIVWLYDAWENELGAIENAMRIHRINIAFGSSQQAARYLQDRSIPNFAAYWLPEAVTITNYSSKPFSERYIDVLHMGRRWDAYHHAIKEFCLRTDIVYHYEERPGANIFTTYQDFLDGLASSKISVCVPSAITHPARSGKISTMTWRYLQSMAAKCLVLGRMPEEMRELFDYVPIVEIDMKDPCGQLRHIIDNYASYMPLVERNYLYVQQQHQWTNRIETMKRDLDQFEQRQISACQPPH